MELELASPQTHAHILDLLLLFKRISASTKTEYAEKLLDTVELVLARVNKPLGDQSPGELRLSTVCLSIVADLVEVN